MVHLGDITKVDGGKIPPVYIITFGSPCQNLSLIGNRSGPVSYTHLDVYKRQVLLIADRGNIGQIFRCAGTDGYFISFLFQIGASFINRNEFLLLYLADLLFRRCV